MSSEVAIYLGVLLLLTFIASLSGAITIGLMLFVVPGLILIASSTLLYYSLALLPAYFIDRLLGQRLLAAAVAIVSLAAAALLPRYISDDLLGRLVAADHSDAPALSDPRSFELPYQENANDWRNWRRQERGSTTPEPVCTDLCQQLLFKGNVDQVVIREPPNPFSDGTIKIGESTNIRAHPNGVIEITKIPAPTDQAAFFKPKVSRFRLQRLETCPDTLSLIEGQFVRDVVGGRCLIEDVIESADAEVVLSISEPPAAWHRRERDSAPSVAFGRIEAGPTTFTISERRDGRAVPAEVKTTLVAHSATVPFYFGPHRCGGVEIPALCVTMATDAFSNSVADPFEMMARRYRLPIESATKSTPRSVVPVAESDRSAVHAILKHDYGADGYIPSTQTRLATSFVNARLKGGELNQDDIELIRALLKQPAFEASIESKLPPSAYDAIKPLLPDMFERVGDVASRKTNLVQSLDVMLSQFPAADTARYALGLCQERESRNLQICNERKLRNPRQK